MDLTRPTERQKIRIAARQAIAAAGGEASCLVKLNLILPKDNQVTANAVKKWCSTGIPPVRVPYMERVQSDLDRHDMRPDHYGERQ